MNKQTKGAIAAGAAALLLAGGAGTMAAWNSTQSLGGGTVSSGKLTLSTVAGSTGWKWVNGPQVGQAFNPASDLLVPGDQVAYNAVVAIGAQGKNLSAKLTADAASITGTNGLDTALTNVVTADVDGTSLPTGAGGATVTSAQDNKNVNVHVNFTLPTSVAGTTAQNGTVNLSNFAVTLTQQ
ncbi:alternate-type signal peptide domain-containing protein [Rhodococcus spelaei]|uniref:Alternate-type signal peptide domain-containing protein n=1 Tax=Rhodococcus spelaei TaxID=2546320 RepID=A0A541B9S2_9NOCA|nr:alternate-type signal peptide domain-containing protein [Rhodococcus spelaei]TQF69064.1 alternate-type signal peptide domain-containing protein [Rhodococcus spelaei]